MSTTVVRWVAEDGSAQTGDAAALARDTSSSPWVWVDVLSPGPDDFAALEARFDLHPLALEDSAHPQGRAKLDVYPGALFLVWITPLHRRGDGVSNSSSSMSSSGATTS